MDRLETMRVFVTVAAQGGFARAARKLGISAPAATRAVAALEEQLGTRLLHRTTRIVRLTEAGTRYAADCERILGELEEADRAASGDAHEPRGLLTVTASFTFGRRYVGPALVELLGLHPQITARTLFVDRIVDIVEEGVDVAVRIAHMPDSTLAAQRVGTVRRVVCAAPAYLERRGTPHAPEDLAGHDILDFSSPGLATWSFGEGRTVAIRPRLVASASDVAVEAAIAGHGITRGLSYVLDPHIKAGRLRRILAEHEPAPIPVQVVHGQGPRPPKRVRAFVDLLVRRLRAERLR